MSKKVNYKTLKTIVFVSISLLIPFGLIFGYPQVSYSALFLALLFLSVYSTFGKRTFLPYRNKRLLFLVRATPMLLFWGVSLFCLALATGDGFENLSRATLAYVGLKLFGLSFLGMSVRGFVTGETVFGIKGKGLVLVQGKAAYFLSFTYFIIGTGGFFLI